MRYSRDHAWQVLAAAWLPKVLLFDPRDSWASPSWRSSRRVASYLNDALGCWLVRRVVENTLLSAFA